MDGRLALLALLAANLAWAKRVDVPEVTKKQLEVAMQEEDYLAVFWREYLGLPYFSSVLVVETR